MPSWIRTDYDSEHDGVCTACGRALSAQGGVGYVLKGIVGPLCGEHYRDFKKQLADKEKGK